MDIRQAEVTAGIAIGQAFMVQAHQVKDCSVQVVKMNLVLHGVVAVIVGLAEPEASAGLEADGRSRVARADSRIRIERLRGLFAGFTSIISAYRIKGFYRMFQ
tara:strand:+ start:465 stop:773 length:309 start_codon:yes stop_codon:yes gene_type:complete